jgi:hypothetical protein
MSETATETTTATVVVYGWGFWGSGNTYNEACRNAPGFNKRKDYHRLFLFTRPIKNVTGTDLGIRWEWVDEEGEFVEADINDKDDAS